MFQLGTPELIIMVIIILLFSVGRIGRISGELSKGVRNFQKEIRGPDNADAKNIKG